MLQHIVFERNRGYKASFAAKITAVVFALAIFINLGITTSMVIGAVLMVLTRSLASEYGRSLRKHRLADRVPGWKDAHS